MNDVRDAHIDSFRSIGHWPDSEVTSDWEMRLGVAPGRGESHPQVAGSTDDLETAQAARFIEITSRNYFCANYHTLWHDWGSDWIHSLPEPHDLRDNPPVILAHTMLVGDF